jgi:hypothetical protein
MQTKYEKVLLNVHDDNKKIVLVTLTYGKCDQFSCFLNHSSFHAVAK